MYVDDSIHLPLELYFDLSGGDLTDPQGARGQPSPVVRESERQLIIWISLFVTLCVHLSYCFSIIDEEINSLMKGLKTVCGTRGFKKKTWFSK